jgi:hypothetical protein
VSNTQETRQRIVNAARGSLLSRSHWKYAEIRPIPFMAFDKVLDGKGGTVTTDCSGLATCCYHRAGAPDPNNEAYNGSGFTGTMLAHLPAIPLARAQVGDLAVFGAFPGKHVVVIVSTGLDPDCISHGGPGDPKIAPLSHFEGLGPLTVLRGVPRVATPKRKQTAKWVVIGDGEKVVGHVYHTRFGWWMRHRGVARRQRELLSFQRLHPSHPSTANAAVHQ